MPLVKLTKRIVFVGEVGDTLTISEEELASDLFKGRAELVEKKKPREMVNQSKGKTKTKAKENDK